MTRLLAILFCFSLFLSPVAFAKEPNRAQIDAVVKSCLKLIQVEDFRGAALMYHYPPDYSKQQLADEIDAVEASLRIFANEFGSFSDVSPLEKNELYLNIYASGGTHAYWDQHQDVFKIELQTEFDNFGPGYLVIHVADIMVVPEIKAIAYGLPVSGQSAEHIKNVGNRMLELMKEQESVETPQSEGQI